MPEVVELAHILTKLVWADSLPDNVNLLVDLCLVVVGYLVWRLVKGHHPLDSGTEPAGQDHQKAPRLQGRTTTNDR